MKTGSPWPGPEEAEHRVRVMQVKLPPGSDPRTHPTEPPRATRNPNPVRAQQGSFAPAGPTCKRVLLQESWHSSNSYHSGSHYRKRSPLACETPLIDGQANHSQRSPPSSGQRHRRWSPSPATSGGGQFANLTPARVWWAPGLFAQLSFSPLARRDPLAGRWSVDDGTTGERLMASGSKGLNRPGRQPGAGTRSLRR